jgi:hypothetical protein
MAAVPKTFAEDFELWAASLLEDGDSPAGIEEIRQAIREALAQSGDVATYWTQRVADEATFIRSNQRRLLAASTESHQ